MDDHRTTQSRLADLLVELFGSHSELRRWIWSDGDYCDLLRQLPSDTVSLRELAGEIVRGLDRRGILPSVFPRLETAFPGRATEIAALARSLGVRPFGRIVPPPRRTLALGALGFLVASLVTLELFEGLDGKMQESKASEKADTPIKLADTSPELFVVQNDANNPGGSDSGANDHAATSRPAAKNRTESKAMPSSPRNKPPENPRSEWVVRGVDEGTEAYNYFVKLDGPEVRKYMTLTMRGGPRSNILCTVTDESGPLYRCKVVRQKGDSSIPVGSVFTSEM